MILGLLTFIISKKDLKFFLFHLINKIPLKERKKSANTTAIPFPNTIIKSGNFQEEFEFLLTNLSDKNENQMTDEDHTSPILTKHIHIVLKNLTIFLIYRMLLIISNEDTLSLHTDLILPNVLGVILRFLEKNTHFSKYRKLSKFIQNMNLEYHVSKLSLDIKEEMANTVESCTASRFNAWFRIRKKN
ncbi:hypothetical protein BpHYR1_044512 [Brachionus plicatilis]|uniref:Uncharacterized protein n=1 Tax=Brachionus plicatilis TaxID=10195 RepID=A0A3M7SZA6_BRAPC|nr:hypothetical protein BpHYR1_044512 [Brachionus plicatilis]